VICLDLAGPGAQVDAEMGIKVRAGDPEQAVRDLADAMRRLAADPDLRRRMGEAARRRSVGDASWRRRGDFLDALYREMIARAGDRVPRGAMTVQGQGGT
jgi:glycosyltransferase involved in cell wall biosynthesis